MISSTNQLKIKYHPCFQWALVRFVRYGCPLLTSEAELPLCFTLKERPERNFFSCCSNPLGHQKARTPEQIPNLMVQTRFGLDDREQHWTGKTDVQVQWKSSLILCVSRFRLGYTCLFLVFKRWRAFDLPRGRAGIRRPQRRCRAQSTCFPSGAADREKHSWTTYGGL